MIPNIVKGRGISGAIRYCQGEGNDKATGKRIELEPGAASRATLLGGLNFGFEVDDARSLDIARRTMEWQAKPENQASRTKKCEQDCLHMTLAWEPGQDPSDAEMLEAARSALRALGLEDARAVVFAHSDTDHRHIHIIASRIDPFTGKTFADTRDQIRAQAWAIQWEREHGQVSEARKELHRLTDAVAAGDGAALVRQLTERNPTFTVKELDRALAYGGLEGRAAEIFRGKILADREVIGLREHADAPVTRYTTRAILAAEGAVLNDARALKEQRAHGLTAKSVAAAGRKHGLNPEQADALRHATGAEGFAMIAGQAGTGKSRTLGAIRDAYESKGFAVIGLAWTNSVVIDMRRDGFRQANTLASELGLYEGADSARTGAAAWNAQTVLMVDEAAMLSTRSLARLLAQARSSGAKVILCGDDKQLASIERGGMFLPLRLEHGAAELSEVMRVRTGDQRAAFNLMHAGEFGPALKLFAAEGALNFAPTQDQAAYQLAARYRADVAADPGKARFIFAATNEQVRMLNGLARDLARQGDRLGTDHAVRTATGEKVFATGDRIQLTGNAPTRKGKEAGYVNGTTGTVTGIEVKNGQTRLTVALDGQAAQRRAISFIVGSGKGAFDQITHGYAGTIYKGQGRTLDQSYVLHSKHWRAASSYVALTRHRERVAVFASSEVAATVDALARLMSRDDARRAASGYARDPAGASRAGGVTQAAALKPDAAAGGRGEAMVERPTDKELRQQVTREAEGLRQLRAQELAQQQEQARAAFTRQAAQASEEARKQRAQVARDEAERQQRGELASASARYGNALADHYDIRNPYGSLAKAAMAEYDAFVKGQEELRREIGKEQDAEKRRLIELRREIEAHDYMAITSQRLAGMSATIAGREDAPQAKLDRAKAEAHAARAAELRQERSAALQARLEREQPGQAGRVAEGAKAPAGTERAGMARALAEETRQAAGQRRPAAQPGQPAGPATPEPVPASRVAYAEHAAQKAKDRDGGGGRSGR